MFLAINDTSPIRRTEIAEQTQVPNDYLTKVLQELDRAGIVIPQRGPGGGYTLNVSPDSLSVYDVVTAISPLPRIATCPLGIADHTKLCPLHKRLDDATALVEDAFRNTMVSELIPGKNVRSCRFPESR